MINSKEKEDANGEMRVSSLDKANVHRTTSTEGTKASTSSSKSKKQHPSDHEKTIPDEVDEQKDMLDYTQGNEIAEIYDAKPNRLIQPKTNGTLSTASSGDDRYRRPRRKRTDNTTSLALTTTMFGADVGYDHLMNTVEGVLERVVTWRNVRRQVLFNSILYFAATIPRFAFRQILLSALPQNMTTLCECPPTVKDAAMKLHDHFILAVTAIPPDVFPLAATGIGVLMAQSIDWLGRRRSTIVMLVVSFLSCAIAMFLPSQAQWLSAAHQLTESLLIVLIVVQTAESVPYAMRPLACVTVMLMRRLAETLVLSQSFLLLPSKYLLAISMGFLLLGIFIAALSDLETVSNLVRKGEEPILLKRLQAAGSAQSTSTRMVEGLMERKMMDLNNEKVYKAVFTGKSIVYVICVLTVNVISLLTLRVTEYRFTVQEELHYFEAKLMLAVSHLLTWTMAAIFSRRERFKTIFVLQLVVGAFVLAIQAIPIDEPSMIRPRDVHRSALLRSLDIVLCLAVNASAELLTCLCIIAICEISPISIRMSAVVCMLFIGRGVGFVIDKSPLFTDEDIVPWTLLGMGYVLLFVSPLVIFCFDAPRRLCDSLLDLLASRKFPQTSEPISAKSPATTTMGSRSLIQ